MEHDLHVRFVSMHALHDHIFPLIQGINNDLLHTLVKLIIQGIDPYHFIEDLFIILSNLGYRKGNNGKASLFPPNITVLQFSGGCHILYCKLLLLFA